MLLKDFYKITSLEKKDAQQYSIVILINEKHEVFKGHFPGNPIMPGVCMMQIIKELTEQITESSLIMESLSNVKFMALINPEVLQELHLVLDVITMDDDKIKVKNTTYFGETVALKLVSVYKKI
ncbi:3-hydroxyacyl-[acyl-carrier-protein] dehydratase [Flavobacterium sp. 28A]|uniref:3-hydroxyacyl-ACP dehydratase n=1 Tax=Flavobacterium sp. 28A TaxID=2735895 RepID=UPI00156D7B46|nr:3-hydroxyacyl-ACP dehydratase [Flavobacterium sp. 28A]NRT14237.1 3-hydroxyacyl-[acyl-carrier-protein] dehydratase [Flavobacterium sp. 28A]